MHYDEFLASLAQDSCPEALDACLRALWYEARGDWDGAHAIVQELAGARAARVHAYLHRKEGDEWNSRYWHRRAGSTFPADLSLAAEWDVLVRGLLEAGRG
ncbi:MAG: hypothetical protein R3F42_06990 [Pseudomonadota bacterium]